jgi:putative chitinase
MSNGFTLSENQLSQIISGNRYVHEWYEVLFQCLPDYDINTKKRIAAFLAQCAHESGNFNFIKENLNYKSETLMRIWPRLYPTKDIADQYAHKPEMIANRSYGGRMGNGPESSGDGYKFCGRGLIQITGRTNYQAFADSLEISINDLPEYLATFEGAVQSACWFWESNDLNKYADVEDIVTITKKINGGTLGLDDRTNRYKNALIILGA